MSVRAAVAAGLLLASAAGEAAACTYLPTPPLDAAGRARAEKMELEWADRRAGELYQQSDFVLVARVVSRGLSRPGRAVAELAVERDLRAKGPQRITLRQTTVETSCGLQPDPTYEARVGAFRRGDQVMVFARRREASLWGQEILLPGTEILEVTWLDSRIARTTLQRSRAVANR